MSGFGWSFVIIGGLLSIGMLNPLPLVGAVLLGMLFDGGTSELQETVKAGGLNPYTPQGGGCLDAFVWLVAAGAFLLVLAMASVIAIEGW